LPEFQPKRDKRRAVSKSLPHDICWVRIHIATGSNLGDRQKHLDEADRQMTESLGLVLRTSPTYRTEAIGMAPETPDFLNRIIELELHAPWKDRPEQVMATLLAIEQEMGRQRPKEGYTSRPIDLDIVLWGNRVLKLDNLQVPHPRMLRRRFVLKPLADLIPEQPIPGDGRTVAQCLADLPEDVPQIAPWP
jgi:2-amino-4-hydroxy-6-hydroxymethyldihydropteridine diphosphokinase